MDDETIWHKCDRAPLFTKVDGRNPLGQMWRRKVNGKWEYRQEPETEEEFLSRQW